MSPVGWFIGKMPVLTIVGVLGAIGALLLVVNLVRDPGSGVNIDVNPGMFWGSIALFPIGIAIYFVSRAPAAAPGLRHRSRLRRDPAGLTR